MTDMNKQIKSLAERIKIVILNQGVWNNVKQHKQETAAENQRHGLDQEHNAEVYIRLTKHESLSKALAVKQRIYQEHRRLTLPSPVDGMRVVPAGREWEHSEVMSRLSREFEKHVSKFLQDYPEVVEKARGKLEPKGLFDPSMFPPKEVMGAKFYNNVKYMPCPSGNKSWDEWLGETAMLGQLELQERIVKSARKLIDACAGDGKLYSAVLDNLDDICDLAGDFNLLEDPIIAKAAKELKAVATDFSAETLRDNQGLRKATAERAADILKVLKLC